MSAEATTTTDPVPPTKSPLFSALVGMVSLAVLLQGVWAGVFLEHDGKRDSYGTWITVHNVGGTISLAFAVIALGVAVVTLRSRKDVVIATAVLVVLLAIEFMLGMLIHSKNKHSLTAIHIPLALVIMSISVILPLRMRMSQQAAGITRAG